MEPNPRTLINTFVVEVGQRQAWPFMTFANNAPTPTVETRLYIDTSFIVAPGPQNRSPMETLNDTNWLTVADVHVMDAAGLTIVFSSGLRLMISGEATAETVGPPWWLGVQ